MTRIPVWAAALAAGALACGGAVAADLPQSTKDILKELNLPESTLAGIEQELTVPAGWEEAAKKEGKVIVERDVGRTQFRKMIKPFQERYPEIEVEYSEGSFNERVTKALVAFQQGRVLSDVLTGFGGSYFQFRDVGALEDLSSLPGWHHPIEGGRDTHNLWVGGRLRYWCMAYNTSLVKESELPKQWEELLTNTRWHNGKIAVGNRPQLWLLMLWGNKGADWTKAYMKDFLSKVKPQLRKEGTNALVSLTIAGEFDAAIPAAAYRVKQYTQKGAPIAWHCPEPVPMAISEMGIMKNSPREHAAKVWMNWFLSKEGQIAQYYSDEAPPVHKDLQDERFLSFPKAIAGKKVAQRFPELTLEEEHLVQAWDPIWANAGGSK